MAILSLFKGPTVRELKVHQNIYTIFHQNASACKLVPQSLNSFGSAKFIHRHRDSDGQGNRMVKETDFRELDDEKLIEAIRNIKPSRFVPFNSELFFKTYEPCEEGFKRDLLGVCREVWD